MPQCQPREVLLLTAICHRRICIESVLTRFQVDFGLSCHLLRVIIADPFDKLSLLLVHRQTCELLLVLMMMMILLVWHQKVGSTILLLPLSCDLLLVMHRWHVSDIDAARRICSRLWEVAQCATHDFGFLF